MEIAEAIGIPVNFNPRSPSGLRHTAGRTCYSRNYDFNPRSPSGLRRRAVPKERSLLLFQSTQPEWAATGNKLGAYEDAKISIHAARVGCDRKANARNSSCSPFQSTQPEWAATFIAVYHLRTKLFQSTQPEWAATME